MGWNVTTMPYQASSMASTCDPMDLDAMNVARDPRKPQMRCYNCNEFGHFAWDCHRPQRRSSQTSSGSWFKGHGKLVKLLHLLEEISEKLEMESEDATYEPEEYNPKNPDLELQYLDTEANLMEIKQGPTVTIRTYTTGFYLFFRVLILES